MRMARRSPSSLAASRAATAFAAVASTGTPATVKASGPAARASPASSNDPTPTTMASSRAAKRIRFITASPRSQRPAQDQSRGDPHLRENHRAKPLKSFGLQLAYFKP
jgi:septal ring-binding cell division protein DamX